MKAIRSLLLGVAAVAGLAIVSTAADANGRRGSIKDGPCCERPFSWTGFYVGGQIGYQWTQDDFSDPVRVPPVVGSIDLDGFIGGVHAGYNAQFGAVVVGIEGDIEWSNASASGTGFIPTGPFVTGHADLNRQASLRGRLGFASGRTLFYATAGVAWGNFDFGYTFPIVGGVTDSFSDTLTGWTVGGGVEHAFAGNWTARIEYRFTDFGNATGSIANCCAPAPNHQRHDLDAHAVRAAISYKF